PIIANLLIDGKEVSSTERLEVRNPARPSEVVGTIVRGTPDHVNAAVAAAKKAQPAWGALTFKQRALALEAGLKKLEDDLDARAEVFVRENGKPFVQARAELVSVPKRQRVAL